MHSYYYTSLLPQWQIPVSLQLDSHIYNLQKNEKGFITILAFWWFYCYLTVWHLFGGLHFVLNRSRSFQIHISGTSFTSRWDRDLVPGKFERLRFAGFYSNLSLQNVWSDRSILYLFLFPAHVQKMVYQSITYIIVPVQAHCTPRFYGIMDTMCARVYVCVCMCVYVCVYVRVCVCLPQQHLCMSDMACMCRSADVSTFGDFHISLLVLILLRPSKCGTIRKYYHWLWALITVYLIQYLPISCLD